MFPNLRAEMARQDIKVPALAEKVGMDARALYRRMSGECDISIGECFAIKEAIGGSFSVDYLFETSSVGCNHDG